MNKKMPNGMNMPPHGPGAPGGMDALPHAELMPDYPRWHRAIIKITISVAAATFLMEVIVYFILSLQGALLISPSRYVQQYLIMPATLNIIIIAGTLLLQRWHPAHITFQNHVPVLSFTFVCTVIASTHYIFSVTLAVFCLPIFMTAIFADVRFCWTITGCTAIGASCTLAIRYFLSTSDPYFWQEGIITYLIIVMAGILSNAVLAMTDGQKNKLLNFAKEAKQAQIREKVANNAKSAFLANISHEIRTPINAVLGMNEMILRETTDPQIREYASNIHMAGNSLLSIINDVLDITKIETGKLDIVEVNYETASLIHDSYNMVAERITKKGLTAIVNCDETLPYRMNGDEVRIRQSIVNLLTNAAKYTEQGTITFSVQGKRLSDDEMQLTISVKDTGIGISEENQKKLFAQFQRVDLEHNRNIEGSGLGLALTKQLVDLMHGSISVKSELGKGSEFTIVLPQKIVDDRPMGKFQKDYIEPYTDNDSPKKQFEAPGANILVVDDVPMNLKVICNLLKKTKIDVDTADSGAKCLEMVQKKKYDLIFMDHMMPEMDGMETMARMKELPVSENRDTPIIMLTANVVAGIKDEYLKAGFTDYLTKPVRGTNLEEMLRQYLPTNSVNTPAANDGDNKNTGGN